MEMSQSCRAVGRNSEAYSATSTRTAQYASLCALRRSLYGIGKLRRLSLTNDAQRPLSSADRRSLDRGTTGNAVRKPAPSLPSPVCRAGRVVFNAAAAPATVSGEPVPQSHWENPGRRCRAATREPGDLPSIRACAGRGASALVALRAACPLPSTACVQVGRGQTPAKHPNPGQMPQAADG
jgi:hypothetical protein